jgi:hypothetical protein
MEPNGMDGQGAKMYVVFFIGLAPTLAAPVIEEYQTP